LKLVPEADIRRLSCVNWVTGFTALKDTKKLYLTAKENLSALGYKDAVLIHGDGFDGLPRYAPFNGILITCGAPEIPEKLLEQLATGGRMVVPVGEKLQEMMVVEKTDDKNYTATGAGYFRFVPMLKGIVN